MTNRSFDTDGTDDPSRRWLGQTVWVRSHPEWGAVRVLRWYPAAGGLPQRLRVMPSGAGAAAQIVELLEVSATPPRAAGPI